MLRRATDAVVVVGLLGVIGWTIAPTADPDERLPETASAPGAGTGPTGRSTLDTAAFDRVLWFVAPPPPAIPPPPKPPEMPRLELVGIIRQGDALRALIVDAADHELRTISAGDTIGVTEVLEITDRGVRCRAYGRSFELLLDGGSGGGS